MQDAAKATYANGIAKFTVIRLLRCLPQLCRGLALTFGAVMSQATL